MMIALNSTNNSMDNQILQWKMSLPVMMVSPS